MHTIPVLICAFELNNVGMTCKMMHDLDFSAYIFDIFFVVKLPLGYGFASQELPGVLVGAKTGDTELATAEFSPKCVSIPEIFHGSVQDIPDVGS
mgnify:CR=1 FL=1